MARGGFGLVARGRERRQDPRQGIPGGRALTPPGDVEAALMTALRPFVRQSGDGVRPPWHIKERRLLDYLIVYIGSGEGVFSVGGDTFPVETGDIVWVPPDTPHEMRGTSRQMRCSYAHFDLIYDPSRSHWDACIPGGTLEMSGLRRFMHPPVSLEPVASWRGKLRLSNGARVAALMGAIHQERFRSPSHSALFVSGLMLQVVAEILRGCQPGTDGARPGEFKAREAAAKIIGSCEGKLDMRSLASELCLSQSHLRKSFKMVHGKSPMTVHIEAKMRRACELLAYSDANVSGVADALGFSNVHNFCRAFKKVVGVTPLGYKRGAAPPQLKSS